VSTRRQRHIRTAIEFNLAALEILSQRGELEAEHLRRLIQNKLIAAGKRKDVNAREAEARMKSLVKQRFVRAQRQIVSAGDASVTYYTITELGLQQLKATRHHSPAASPAPASPA